MINRLLIRVKTVQLAYATLQCHESRLYADEKLMEAVEASQKLYNFLLALIVKTTDYRRKQIEANKKKFFPTEEDLHPNTRFVDNQIARMISERSEVLDYCEKEQLTSDFDTELYRAIIEQLEQTEVYQRIMTQTSLPTFDDDKALWIEALNTVFPQCEKLDEVLEERNIYWNDDLTTVITAVVRAITALKPNSQMVKAGKTFTRDEDQLFAMELFHQALDEYAENVKLIDSITPNWEVDRMAMLDKVIISTGMSEIRHFFDIPVTVSINEYVELAKHYGSANSGRFINGILDKIAAKWREEGVIAKK